MHPPDALHGLTLDAAPAPGPYPPNGFWPLAEGALGNGDGFGLYWPLGREHAPPLVCELVHDEGQLIPRHASVAAFQRWLALNDGEWGEREADEPDAPQACWTRIRAALAGGDAGAALDELEALCGRVPDVAAFWQALSAQRRRLGDIPGSVAAARAALCANWAFGLPGEPTLRTLRGAPADAADPVLALGARLQLQFGGSKHNPDYALLREGIAACLDRREHLDALRLLHNYAYALQAETVAFQQREGFVLEQWQAEFTALCARHLGDDRRTLR